MIFLETLCFSYWLNFPYTDCSILQYYTEHCRVRRVVDQQLREDQDAAYQESLAADREKERKRQEALEREEAEARLAREKQEEEKRQKEVVCVCVCMCVVQTLSSCRCCAE